MAGSFTAKYKQFLPSGAEDVWIETGTYCGNGVRAALGFGFRELHTIEVCSDRFLELGMNDKTLCADSRVNRYFGSSRILLQPLIEQLINRNVVFWLDAHYAGESQDERDAVSECPLVAELDAIGRAPWEQSVVVCIDDSNLFANSYWIDGSGREKFTSADWPREDQLLAMMEGWHSASDDNQLYFYR